MAKSEGERKLTDTGLQALKPAQAGTSYEVRDKITPGLVVRVSPKGTKSFMLKARFGGSKNPTRRLLGTYDPAALPAATEGAITLETARRKAREWAAMVKGGSDPATVEAERKKRQLAATNGSFAKVAEDYIREAVIGRSPENPKHRQWRQVVRDIRTVFVPLWGTKHIAAIERREIIDFLKEKGKTAPGRARNLYIGLRSLFGWARDQDDYGLIHSPCEAIKISTLLGSKNERRRVLTDAELRAMWTNTRMGYPYGPVLRVLMLTGLRRNEVAQASWDEFDFTERRWIIPARRMKGRNDHAREHLVPITDDILAVLQSLPRFNEGRFIFSTTNGRKPVRISTTFKKRLDGRMRRMLGELKPYVVHDIRRTVRTRLSGLHIKEEVREAVLAHARPGVKGNYDCYEYEHEKREALELWAQRLKQIKAQYRGNVIPIRGSAS